MKFKGIPVAKGIYLIRKEYKAEKSRNTNENIFIFEMYTSPFPGPCKLLIKSK